MKLHTHNGLKIAHFETKISETLLNEKLSTLINYFESKFNFSLLSTQAEVQSRQKLNEKHSKSCSSTTLKVRAGGKL